MANITEVSQWESVIRQIENGEAATGGADGLANIQAKQLANRTQWLKNNYLPLSGGRMNKNTIVSQVGDDGRLELYSGETFEKGAHIVLNAINNSNNGAFYLKTPESLPDGTAVKGSLLSGYIDGRLTHNKNDLAGSAIVAKSLGATGYVKYASGLTIQWGSVAVTSSDKTVTVDNVTAIGETVTRLRKSVYPPLSTSKIYSVNCITQGEASRFFMCETFNKGNYFDVYVLTDYIGAGAGRSVSYILIGGE